MEGQSQRYQSFAPHIVAHGTTVGICGRGSVSTNPEMREPTLGVQGGGDSKTMVHPSISDSKPIVGSDVSAGLFSPHLPSSLSKPTRTIPSWSDLRDTVPLDLAQVNTTPMEEPVRQLLYPDDRWVELETGKPPHFPVEPLLSPQMEHMDRRCPQSRVPLPVEIVPVIKQRMIISMPELSTECPNVDLMYGDLGGALVFWRRQGPKKPPNAPCPHWLSDVKSIPPTHALGDLRRRYVWVIRRCALIPVVSIGELDWLGIDFGENLPMGDKLRTALSEGGEVECNQRAALHLEASYEWALQGRPRGHPSLSRVQTVGTLLRQEESQEAFDRMTTSCEPAGLRDFEVASSARDVISAHRDRGFEDLDLSSAPHSKHR